MTEHSQENNNEENTAVYERLKLIAVALGTGALVVTGGLYVLFDNLDFLRDDLQRVDLSGISPIDAANNIV